MSMFCIFRQMGYDEMVYGRKDPQDIAPVAYCLHCGREIYPGEEPWQPDDEDGFVHRECVKDYMFEHYAKTIGSFVEVRGTEDED